LVATGRPVTAAVSGRVADLTKGAMRAMFWTRIKVVTACAVLVVGALGVGGVLGRQTAGSSDGPPDGKADPPRQAQAPARPEKAGAGEQPKEKGKPPAAEKPAEKRYSLSMENRPWAEVFQWLSDETGLAYVGAFKPTGTFTFVPPRAGGGVKQYTITE